MSFEIAMFWVEGPGNLEGLLKHSHHLYSNSFGNISLWQNKKKKSWTIALLQEANLFEYWGILGQT